MKSLTFCHDASVVITFKADKLSSTRDFPQQISGFVACPQPASYDPSRILQNYKSQQRTPRGQAPATLPEVALLQHLEFHLSRAWTKSSFTWIDTSLRAASLFASVQDGTAIVNSIQCAVDTCDGEGKCTAAATRCGLRSEWAVTDRALERVTSYVYQTLSWLAAYYLCSRLFSSAVVQAQIHHSSACLALPLVVTKE